MSDDTNMHKPTDWGVNQSADQPQSTPPHAHQPGNHDTGHTNDAPVHHGHQPTHQNTAEHHGSAPAHSHAGQPHQTQPHQINDHTGEANQALPHQVASPAHQPESSSASVHNDSAVYHHSADSASHDALRPASITAHHDQPTHHSLAEHYSPAPAHSHNVPSHDSLAGHQTVPADAQSFQSAQTLPVMGQAMATAGAVAGASTMPANGVAGAPTSAPEQSLAFHGMPNTYNGAKKSHLKLILIILGVLVVGGVATAYGVYTSFVTDPQQALGSYLYRLSHSKTVNYDAKLESGDTKISAKGSYDITDMKKPKVDLTADYTDGKQNYGGQLKLIDMVAYFKLDQSTAKQLGVPKLVDWYKYDLSDLGKDSKDAETATDCSTDPKLQGQIFGQDTLLDFPVKDAKRVGLYETVNGIKTSHFTGEIDFAKLGTKIDELNKKLPEKCKLDYRASDYDKSKVTYDIWSGLNFDKLILHTSSTDGPGDKADITLETKDYDKEVKIETPANAKDFSSILSDIDSGGGKDNMSGIGDAAPTTIAKLLDTLTKPNKTIDSLQAKFKSASSALTKSTGFSVTKSTVSVPVEDTAPVALRNQQRQTDVNAIARALYQYRIDNGGNLPTGISTTAVGLCKTDVKCDVLLNLTALTQDSKYLAKLPVDPSATGQYSTGYEVSIDGLNHIVVRAPLAENGVSIGIIR